MQGDLTPEDVSRGWNSTVRDEDLPMLAARWLAQGWDTDQLRELAAMSPSDARSEAHRLLPEVLTSLGFHDQRPLSPWDEMHWRGYWGQIAWARDEMDRLLTPYAAAQRVLEVVGDVPDLWASGRGERLMSLLAQWDAESGGRERVEEELRQTIRTLRRDDVPPLVPREQSDRE